MSTLFHFIYVQPKWLVSVVAICAVLIWGILGRLLSRDETYFKAFRAMSAALFLLIIGGIIYKTLYTRAAGTERVLDLVPFNKERYYTMHEEFFRTLIMNIALFIPFGMSLPFLIYRVKRPVLTTIIVGAALSLVIETLQYVFVLGNAELDDFLMNTLGAAIGTLSFVICRYKNKNL